MITRKTARAFFEALESRQMFSAGALDETFGTGGIVPGIPGFLAGATAVQRNGKVVLAGAWGQDVAVARLNANVYFVECGGQALPNSSRATTAPVGCRVHLDCTARDGSNNPTIPRGTPRWTYSDPGLITVGGGSPFNPVITAKGRGHIDFYAEVDGVRSETRGIDFE